MYCDYSDIVAEIGEEDIILYTDDTNAGSVNETNLARCIEWADRLMIDPMLRRLFVVPFSPVPIEIKTISLDLVIYKLFERRGAQAKQQQRYDRAIAKLRALRSGTDVLNVEMPAGASTAGVIKAAPVTGSVFTRDALGGY